MRLAMRRKTSRVAGDRRRPSDGPTSCMQSGARRPATNRRAPTDNGAILQHACRRANDSKRRQPPRGQAPCSSLHLARGRFFSPAEKSTESALGRDGNLHEPKTKAHEWTRPSPYVKNLRATPAHHGARGHHRRDGVRSLPRWSMGERSRVMLLPLPGVAQNGTTVAGN